MVVHQPTDLGELDPAADDLDDWQADGGREGLELVRDRRLAEAEGVGGA